MSLKKTEITVLGGGVIGLSVALRMLNAGREVTLIDPRSLGLGPHLAMLALSRNTLSCQLDLQKLLDSYPLFYLIRIVL
jgi:2-polyprenyl-6-methoxyphenol hydroxylase-like FAD-dependent oxidoreductase